VAYKKGDLVRWIVDHSIYEASGDVLVGVSPNYRHGLIMEVSTIDPTSIMVYCYDCKKKREGNWVILRAGEDKFEIISGAAHG